MNSCIAILLLASLVVLSYGSLEDYRKKVKVAHDACQGDPKTQIDEELLRKFRRGEVVDKAVVGGHAVCMSTQMGFLDENGKVNKDVIRRELSGIISDETKLNEAVKKCTVDKDDTKDTALAIGKCFVEYAGPSTHH